MIEDEVSALPRNFWIGLPIQAESDPSRMEVCTAASTSDWHIRVGFKSTEVGFWWKSLKVADGK